MLSRPDLLVVLAYYALLTILAVYGMHRFHLVRLLRRHDSVRTEVPPDPQRWPDLTVQLPVFNEPKVVARLLESVAALRYPGRLDFQLLDDSTDETSAIAAAKIAELRARGIAIAHIQRPVRQGYKAGALAEGLRRSSSDLFAVFDADFVPHPDTLTRLVPWFASDVGMVQARWEHLNRTDSQLTQTQSIYLDGHFAVESAARFLSGRFFNFNGTAGIWRREAIEDAGGWSASTVTEDLDLSYRAQLAGWKFTFVASVAVPAELPGSLDGFRQQQHRWVKGSIQCARRLLPQILGSALPLRTRIEAFFHLTNNVAYLLTALLAFAIVPSILIRDRLGLMWTLVFDVLLFALSTVSVLLFYLEGQRRVGRSVRPRDFLFVLPLGIGMSIRNSTAVLEGLLTSGGVFRRTPKRGNGIAFPDGEKPAALPFLETGLAIFFLISLAVLAVDGKLASVPFLLLFLGGYGFVSVRGISERFSH